jgi:hypothetical protein
MIGQNNSKTNDMVGQILSDFIIKKGKKNHLIKTLFQSFDWTIEFSR